MGQGRDGRARAALKQSKIVLDNVVGTLKRFQNTFTHHKNV